MKSHRLLLALFWCNVLLKALCSLAISKWRLTCVIHHSSIRLLIATQTGVRPSSVMWLRDIASKKWLQTKDDCCKYFNAFEGCDETVGCLLHFQCFILSQKDIKSIKWIGFHKLASAANVKTYQHSFSDVRPIYIMFYNALDMTMCLKRLLITSHVLIKILNASIVWCRSQQQHAYFAFYVAYCAATRYVNLQNADWTQEQNNNSHRQTKLMKTRMNEFRLWHITTAQLESWTYLMYFRIFYCK